MVVGYRLPIDRFAEAEHYISGGPNPPLKYQKFRTEIFLMAQGTFLALSG